MKEIISRIRKDKILSTSFTTTGVIIVFNLLHIIFFYNNLPPFIPLYNQLPWGEKRLGTLPEIFIPLTVVLIVFTINSIFSSILYPKMPLVSRILAITSLLISFFALLFSVRTVGLLL